MSQLRDGEQQDVSQLEVLIDEANWVFSHPGMTVACRPLRLDEAPAAAEIEATRFHPSTSVQGFESFILGQNSLCCGVFVSDTLVGCASANITPPLGEDSSEAFIDNISILEPYAGCGLGLLLTAYLLKCATKAPYLCSRATLEVRPSNTSARRIYSRLGFTCHGIRKRYYSHPTEDAEIHWLEDMGLPTFQDVLLDSVSHALELFDVKQLGARGGTV
ncbi:MAG: GNAT family N-acetyltransferase [Armatimonadota bacterium]